MQEDYDILRVVPINQLELETDYYRFRYLRPPVPYKGVMTNQGSGGDTRQLPERGPNRRP